MPSPQLTLAAQTNGKLSRGPVTPEGKRKSSANSRKHGLRSKTLQTDEACEALRQWLLPSLIAKYNPANPVELNLVETVALAAAQQEWALRIFDQHLADAIEHQSNPDAPYKHPGRHAMPLLHRAYCRFDRQERRARQQLRQIQSQKMHERTRSVPPAVEAITKAQATTPPPTTPKMNERTEFPPTLPPPSPAPHRIPQAKIEKPHPSRPVACPR